ncbi:hypothetical protein B0H14DRAFT_3908502 [Mycena olivaceomarginata]|nr:hypothetical protein B0H14DRAFT_3908502 [Mycena olivaceomarginata]
MAQQDRKGIVDVGFEGLGRGQGLIRGRRLLKAPDTPGDDSDVEGEAEGARAGSAAGRERGEGSGTFPPPKRAGLLVLILFCFWLAFQIKSHRASLKVVHASRYSKVFKYRPAASPIVTETLKDGRVRFRGAAPTSSTTPAPKPTPAKPKTAKRKGGKGKGKKKRVAAKKPTLDRRRALSPLQPLRHTPSPPISTAPPH